MSVFSNTESTYSHRHVSTSFIYFPRSRPASPIPQSLYHTASGFHVTPDWKVFESVLRSKTTVRPDIITKFYLPTSRIFSMTQPIPFCLTLESSAVSLAAFLPFGPTSRTLGRKMTCVQLMRQTTVDVRWVGSLFYGLSFSLVLTISASRNTVIAGVKTDIWRVDCIGDGTFKRAVCTQLNH